MHELSRRVVLADLRAYRALRAHVPHGASVLRPIQAFSWLGEHGACWFALGAVGAALDHGERRRDWLRGVRAVALTYALNTVLKLVIRRRRPSFPDLPPLATTPTTLSFPSAHASLSFAAARSYSRVAPATPLYSAAALMALSRVYLGVHYPSDVVAGAALGTAVGALT